MGKESSLKENNNIQESIIEDVDELKNEKDEDFFATGSLIYNEESNKELKNNHHLLLLMNAFNLNH